MTQKWDIVVPVPCCIHSRSASGNLTRPNALARHLGRALRLPVNTSLVRRAKFTGTQTLLTRPQRAANVDDAFAPSAGKQLDGEKISIGGRKMF